MDIDAEIFKRIQAGDQKAFAVLYKKYRPRLWSYYGRWGIVEEDREDLIQKTMMQVWRYRGSFDFRHNISTWIFKIAKNCSTDLHKNHLKRELRDVSIDGSSDAGYVSEDGFSEQKRIYTELNLRPIFDTPLVDQLDKTYRHMDKIFQEAFIAYITGTTIAEHSAELKVPTGTIKSRRFRAQKILAEGVQDKLWIREFQNKQFV